MTSASPAMVMGVLNPVCGGRSLPFGRMDSADASQTEELDGSTVIWAIMAVTGLWLLGLFAVAIGYTLFECLGPCNDPSASWVWWL